jgi:hypothetical protein
MLFLRPVFNAWPAIFRKSMAKGLMAVKQTYSSEISALLGQLASSVWHKCGIGTYKMFVL